MLHAVHAVLFDLDNTLADRDLAFAAWARWFVRERLDLTDDAAVEVAVATLIDLDASGHAPKDVVFRTLKDQHAILVESVEALVVAFRDQLLTHLPPLDAGAARLLAALDDSRISWGIVSNGSRSQLLKIRKLELETRAACIVISEVVGVRKPDPAIFQTAAERLDVAPDTVLFVGDHPEADVVGAAGAGMQTAWLRRGREWPARLAPRAPHHSIDSLADLLWVTSAPHGRGVPPPWNRS